MNERIRAMAAASDAYRTACAQAVQPGKNSILVCQRGHGTAIIAAMAAERCSASRALLVTDRSQTGVWKDQLERAGYQVNVVPPKKDAALEACRDAMRQEDGGLGIYLASQSHLAGIGHWCDAWPEKQAFDFIAVLDADRYVNLKSEKGRGLDTAIRRASSSVLFCDCSGAGPARIPDMAEAWGAEVCAPAQPRQAACACEAMGMDTD